ncbi:glycosyltransferase family 39 protein [Pokkaliibacter sp. MBI-7]|uniref:ArnT family glycosyltransferase n=1 Tax=Pokkaliibacter sp. MBI-7 TaxID=3040600 RepID=UPI0024474AFC|nr:glycosyltransferase family 39 protein [Pokkaliibacter sp. MBI-7]MDH2435819.1 glycosyltransferase family 39 protein [Pokkaliibacter sp. MBI-7]
MRTQHPWWPLALMTLYVLAAFSLGLGNVPLFDVDEGAFSEATREMIHSGIWSATYLDGVPRYDKPILTYWFQAANVLLFGLNETTLRLHSALSAIGWAASIYYFSKEFINRRSAMVAVLIFSSTLWIMLIGRAATADALLNLFIALSFFDLYRYQSSGKKTLLYRTWLWLSLGMLTKGPVAAAIPFVASLIWFTSYGRLRDWSKAVLNPTGWLILAVVLVPWLILVWQQQGMGFFRGFLIGHNLNRLTSTMEGHGGHWYYYLLVLPLIMLPYTGALLTLLRHGCSLWKRPLERLLIIWFAVVMVLFSLSQTQLPHYILYGVTPLIVLMAKYRQVIIRRWQLLLPILFFALQIGLVLYAPHLGSSQHNAYQRQMLSQAPEVLNQGYLLMAALLTGLTALLFWPPSALRRLAPWQRLTTAGLLQTLFASQLLLPAIGHLQQTPVKQAALQARQLQTSTVVAYKIHMPSFSLYRGAPTPSGDPQAGDVVLTKADHLPELLERFPAAEATILYHQGGIVLARMPASPATLSQRQ